MERAGSVERARRILEIFIVATEPVAASSRCFLLSEAKSEARKGELDRSICSERFEA